MVIPHYPFDLVSVCEMFQNVPHRGPVLQSQPLTCACLVLQTQLYNGPGYFEAQVLGNHLEDLWLQVAPYTHLQELCQHLQLLFFFFFFVLSKYCILTIHYRKKDLELYSEGQIKHGWTHSSFTPWRG